MNIVQRSSLVATSAPWKAVIDKGPEGTTIKLIDTTPGRREDGMRPMAQIVTDTAGLQALRSFIDGLEGLL